MISREESARDARSMDLIRAAQHADKKEYKDFRKKMADNGG